MGDDRDAGGSVIDFPRRPDPKRPEGGTKRFSERRFYPRRFHPFREPGPFFLLILITVIGAVLVIGAGWTVLQVHKAQNADPETSAPGR